MSLLTQPPGGSPSFPGRRLARITVRQYEAMIASGAFTKNDRFELIEGNLVEKTTKHPPHAVVTVLCAHKLSPLVPTGWHAREEKPIRIPARDSEPEPDVALARGQITDYLQQHPGPADLALVTEVADSSVDEDRALAITYGAASIPVYWIINIPDRQIELYTEPSGPTPPLGYRRIIVLRPGDDIPLVIDGREIARIPVAELLP
jgi:Uma2 family endonuclease